MWLLGTDLATLEFRTKTRDFPSAAVGANDANADNSRRRQNIQINWVYFHFVTSVRRSDEVAQKQEGALFEE